MLTTKVRDRELMMLSMTLLRVESRGDGGLVKVCSGGHGKLEDDVLAFQGVVVVVNSAIGGTARLELEVIVASSALFFEKGCDIS